MMSGVEERGSGHVSIASIGASIRPPPVQADGARPADRLEELARWWSQVSTTGSPKRVEHLWSGDRSFEPPDATQDAVAWAIAAADHAIDGGADLVLLTVPGTGVIAPAVLAAHLLHLDAADAAGWPSVTGASDLSWMITVTTIRDGLRRLRGPFAGGPDADGDGEAGTEADPAAVLDRLGDRSIAAGCAAVLRCASRRTPLLLDGPAAAVCGLFAQQINRAAAGWWRAADGPIQPGLSGGSVVPGTRDAVHERVLGALHQEPLIRLGLARADGTAAQIALGVLTAAIERSAG